MKGWNRRPDFVKAWLPFCRNWTCSDVLEGLPQYLRSSFNHVNPFSRLPTKIVAQLQRKADASNMKNSQRTFLVHGGLTTLSTQRKVKMAQYAHDNFEFISAATKRVDGGGRKNKYENVVDWILHELQQHYDHGDLLTLDRLYRMLHAHFRPPNDFANCLLDERSSTYPDSLRKWVKRVLTKYRWAVRTQTIMQEVPQDWNIRAVENAKAIREVIEGLNADVVIAADEVIFYSPLHIVWN